MPRKNKREHFSGCGPTSRCMHDWDRQAELDMLRIALSDEDLSNEPDDWGYDEDGNVVDFR